MLQMRIGKNIFIKAVSADGDMADPDEPFGRIPKDLWESHAKPDRRNRIRIQDLPPQARRTGNDS